MVALARVMAIIHYKIAMPMWWLAGNTHHMPAVGYDWSARSMGKAIDALHDVLVELVEDGSKFLDEDFMNNIFSEIDEDENHNKRPLEPLVDAMQYYMGKNDVQIVSNYVYCLSHHLLHVPEEKQTTTVDGSARVLPYDKINAELFYPTREENKQTTTMVLKMAVEVAECFLKELRDPKKATSDYLTSEGGQFSWGYTTEDEHMASLGKMATNDPAESPFAALTTAGLAEDCTPT